MEVEKPLFYSSPLTPTSKFRILANISEKLPNDKKPILVGGNAVEF